MYCDNEMFLSDMMSFASEVYLPFLAANSGAVEQGLTKTEVTLWQGSQPIHHSQPSFKYQHKCYHRIKQSFQNLTEHQRQSLKGLSSLY